MFHNTIPFASYSPFEELFGGALHYLVRLSLSAPYSVSKFTIGKVKLMLAGLLNGNKFDVAVCDFLSASLNFSIKSYATVLFQHNVESALETASSARIELVTESLPTRSDQNAPL